MEKILKLACELDQFSCAYDPYEYADCIEDPIQNIIETARLIQRGETGRIIEWLQAIADDSDEETDDIETAKKLLQSIKERKNENESTYGRTT